MSSASTVVLTLPVLGMTCTACQHHIESSLRAAPGVELVRVDLIANRVSIIYDSNLITPKIIIHAIQSAGYDAVLPRKGETQQAHSYSLLENDLTHKAWITLVAGVVVMVLTMPIDSKMSKIDHLLMNGIPWIFHVPFAFLSWFIFILTAVLMFWAGCSIYLNALRALLHKTTNMNTLVGLGTSIAFLWSAYVVLLQKHNQKTYFDAVLMILGFLLLGKALEARAKQRALAALNALNQLQPTLARRITDGKESLIPLDEIQLGDHILVLPGERFPADAVITEGITTIDESMLTGEPTPQVINIGDKVFSGSLNYDGAVVCQIASTGEHTVLSQIARMMEQAQSSRAPMEMLADRASAVFVPVVLLLAVFTFSIWMLTTHSISLALANTVAVLVVACPCAMGLAVPAALTVAVGRGAQLGILFKNGEALERLTNLDVIALDKTGTLTVGHPVLETIHTLSGTSEADLLRIAASAEKHSNHPLAHALVNAANSRGLTWQAAKNVQVLPGRGLIADVDDRKCLIGNEALFAEYFVSLPKDLPSSSAGITRLWMALDHTPVAAFDARDALRPDAIEAVQTLKLLKLRAIMLTGDSQVAALPVAQQVMVEELKAGLSPQGKLDYIRQIQKKGARVAMVGDGINDAAALAQADAGITVASGTDLAQDAGDVLLMRSSPTAIPDSITLARYTIRIMQQNLAWAVAYNLLGIPLAAGILYPGFHILLSPWLAASAMALSSVSVLANSLRLRRWQPAQTR